MRGTGLSSAHARSTTWRSAARPLDRPQRRVPGPVGDADERGADCRVAAVRLEGCGNRPRIAVARQLREPSAEALLDLAGSLDPELRLLSPTDRARPERVDRGTQVRCGLVDP